ncbi:MAG TPA: hypothetical protein VHU40_00335 [Polyangia bacterium]|nr:hypothetical protein [Polyangia bacterium]
MIRGAGWWVLVLGLGVVGAAGPAHAYVRYETGTGNPFSWRTPSVKLVGYPYGLPSMPTEDIVATMQTSVTAWSKEDPENAVCSYLALSLSVKPDTVVPPAAAHDDENSIAIRNGNWEAICSTTKDGKTVCHQPGELALTTVWSRTCGEIVEADVEVNASKDFAWADLSITDDPGLQDLQNALTHELGHFIGLDHTCLLAPLVDPTTGQPIEPVDNTGAKVPLCTPDLPLTIRGATMFPSAQPGDVSKRSLSADDRMGLCQIYPKGTTPEQCGVGSSGGACAIAPDDAPTGRGRSRLPWAIATIGVTGVLFALRRRSAPDRRR